MLSPLQQQISGLIAHLPEADDFALAGGAALIARGDVDRPTRDLDYFARSPDQVDRLLPLLEGALRAAGLEVERRQVAAGFARLVVTGHGDRTEVDLAADARLLPAEATDLGRVLARKELAVDKLLAVFGRAEARDFLDLRHLEPRYGLAELCRLAAEKDHGFRVDVLHGMLDRFERLPRDEFDVDDVGFAQVVAAVSRWRDELGAGLAPPTARPERGRGLDL